MEGGNCGWRIEEGYGHRFLLQGAASVYVLTAKRDAVSSLLAQKGTAAPLRTLDVVVLDQVLLRDLLGLSDQFLANERNISFMHDFAEALEAVKSGRYDAGFFINQHANRTGPGSCKRRSDNASQVHLLLSEGYIRAGDKPSFPRRGNCLTEDLEKRPQTSDALFGGRLIVYQEEKGYRFSLDAVLLAGLTRIKKRRPGDRSGDRLRRDTARAGLSEKRQS